MNDKEDIYKLEDDVEENKRNNNDKEDLKKKLIKYGIIAISGFIFFIFILAFITSCSSKPKKKLSETLNLSVGDKYNLSYSDFTWTSSNNDVAIVEGNAIEILKNGDAVVTVTTSNEIITYTIHSEEKEANVTGIKLSSNTIEIENGKTYELTANLMPNNSKSSISWYSSNEEVATVKDGIVKAVAPGTCMITVKTENGYLDTCLVKVLGENSSTPVKSIEIDSIDVSLNVGTSYPLSYSVEPSDSINLITWESSNNEIATVDNGIIYPVSKGNVKIIAKSGNVVEEIEVTVEDKEKFTLNQTNISLYVGESYSLLSSVDDTAITWSSSSDMVAEVVNGLVVAKASGTSIITAKKGDSTATCTVTVINKQEVEEEISLNISEASINVGDSINLVETVTPSNNVSSVVWSSSDESVAKVEKGVVTGLKDGVSTITASLPNGKSAECKVTVSQKTVRVINIRLNANTVYIKVNGSSQLTAKVLPENATDKSIKWTSSDSGVATVDANGKVTAKKTGRAVIYATGVNGIHDECEIIVTKK